MFGPFRLSSRGFLEYRVTILKTIKKIRPLLSAKWELVLNPLLDKLKATAMLSETYRVTQRHLTLRILYQCLKSGDRLEGALPQPVVNTTNFFHWSGQIAGCCLQQADRL